MPLIWTRADSSVASGILMLISVSTGGAFASLVPMLMDRGDNLLRKPHASRDWLESPSSPVEAASAGYSTASTQRAFSPACVWPWRRRSCSSSTPTVKFSMPLPRSCSAAFSEQRSTSPPFWSAVTLATLPSAAYMASPSVCSLWQSGIGPLVLGMSYDHMGGYQSWPAALCRSQAHCGLP